MNKLGFAISFCIAIVGFSSSPSVSAGVSNAHAQSRRSSYYDEIYLDKNGKPVYFVPHGHKVLVFNEGLAPNGSDFKFGFVDSTLTYKIQPIYQEAKAFTEGLAVVRINDKYGFIDKSGTLVIDALYDDAAGFSEGFAAVKIEGKVGFIDKSGRWRIRPQFDEVGGFSEGLSLVSQSQPGSGEANRFYVDHNGLVVIASPGIVQNNYVLACEPSDIALSSGSGYFLSPAYTDWATFSEGLAPLAVDGKFGFINNSGRLVIPAKFEQASPVRNGIAIVKQNGKFGYIDRTGKILVAPQFERALPFSEGLAAVAIEQNKWGYINSSGNFVIQPKYYEAKSFVDGVACVTTPNFKCKCH